MNDIEITDYRDLQVSLQLVKNGMQEDEKNNMDAKLTFGTKDAIRIRMGVMSENTLRADVNIKDYVSEGLEDFFVKNIQFKVDIVYKNGGTDTEKVTKTEHLNIKDNTEKILTQTTDGYAVTAYVIYRCHGYTGYNCELPNTKTSKYYRHHLTKAAMCRNKDDCGDEKCPDKKFCNDHGDCFIKSFGDRSEYCVCEGNYYGKNCESQFTASKLQIEEILFVPKDNIRIPKTEDRECGDCTMTPCWKYEEIIVCQKHDATTGMIIKDFDEEWEEICGIDYCMFADQDGNNQYYYLKSIRESSLALQNKGNGGQAPNQQGSGEGAPNKNGAEG